MSFPTPHYHADSDADDEYERSILTSPMPPTDDETSSVGDSEHGSHEHTPTTFEASDYGRSSPRTIITEWSTEECARFLGSLGLGQYGRAFKENEIVGEAIVQLHHDELKEMGVKSMGHRLTILGAVYDTKVKQNVDIDLDHYIPPSKEEESKSRQATQEDLSRIIHSIQMRDQRILDAELALRRVQEKYDKLREELLPVFKMAKEKNASLPSPVFPNGSSSLGRSGSTKNKKELVLSSTPSIIQNASPTWPPPERSSIVDSNVSASAASNAATSTLAAEAIAMNSLEVGPFPSPNNFPSPGVSPGTHYQGTIDRQRYGSQSVYDPPTASTPIHDYDRDRNSILRPGTAQAQRRNNTAPSIIEKQDESGPPAVEVFKSFRVSMDDPCYKVLPAALKRYQIDADWKQYALYIVYGDQERCLGLEEKPLILFKQLDKEGRKPMFMLRRHVTPEHGFTGPNSGAANSFGQNLQDRNGSKIQLPGGML